MAIWNNKFDRVNGETRECRKCNTQFHTFKPNWVCIKCNNETQRLIEKKKRETNGGNKENYPFSSVKNEAGARFSKIRQKLRKAWEEGPEAVKEHYDRQLKEAEELGIMKWIWDRRDNETIKARSEKSRNYIAKEWPDTRGHYEE